MSYNIFFSTSDSYVQHFTVSAVSLLENNRDLNIGIYVVHEGAAPKALLLSKIFIEETYNVQVTLLEFRQTELPDLNTDAYYGKYTLFRLFLADVAPANLDKILFMDVDTVVTGSIRELLNTNLNTFGLAAVSEKSVADNVLRLSALGENMLSYFNAGVILIDLNYWREHQLTKKFMSIAARYGRKLVWVDQDILNIAFANKCVQLDEKYNGVHIQEKRLVTPVIVHYNTVSKPWHYVDTHPYKNLYLKYLAMTPFKDYRASDVTLKNIVLRNGRLFKRILRNNGIIK